MQGATTSSGSSGGRVRKPATRRRATSPKAKAPNLKVEQALLADGFLLVAGSDEVGRGSLGGPVTAGVAIVDLATKRPPTGLRDSKLLTPAAREALVPRIEQWVHASAVGHATAAEIDEVGILSALRLAGERAIVALGDAYPDVIVLDGNYDWFRRPDPHRTSPMRRALDRVDLRIKADLTCASVAAASVLAKVARDRLMVQMAEEHPGYEWHLNKGYASPAHLAALRELGPCVQHRRSWNLAGPVGSDLV